MSGVTDMPFRRLVKRSGAGLVISEMIASEAVIRDHIKSKHKAINNPDEEPMAVQLAGCDPNSMAKAAKLNEDCGAVIIDINMGCPAKKVVNGYAGSALMRDLSHARKIIEATVNAVKLPVTLKMRTGWDDNCRNAPELAKIAEDCGIKMITVHGRTRCQFYSGRSDWEFIQQVKEAIKLPVIANGDITSEEDAAICLAASGADGVMIGRGCYGRPWFINQVEHYLASGDKKDAPSVEEQRETLIKHVLDMYDHYGENPGVRLARKHISWYSKSHPNSSDFRAKVNIENDPKLVFQHINNFYNEALEYYATKPEVKK